MVVHLNGKILIRTGHLAQFINNNDLSILKLTIQSSFNGTVSVAHDI